MLRPGLRVAQRCCVCSSKLLGRSQASPLPNLASATSRVSPPLRLIQQQTLQNFGTTARAYSSSDSPSIPPTSQQHPDYDPEQDLGPPAVRTTENDPAVEETIETTETKPPSTSDLPWYLEVEPPRHPTLIPQQHPLPEIPANAPKLMGPLFKFVSDELGIDRLTLLDLRDLDPPPALGPRLLMLFGSARMERHLHVSADRLVRWLAGHGIQAEADGLMSRNELKLKMRRAARRNKTITAAGGSSSGDNQALATSWICVNLGTMGWSSEEVAITDSEGRVAGFGAPQAGTTMVVQLFTEAKRKELDLETLWSRQLERSERRAAEVAGLPKPDRLADPFLEKFGDAAEPNRKTRRQVLQNKGF